MKRFLFLAALLVLAAPILAQTLWTGTTSTSWHTTTNWNPAVVPNSTTDVVIPGGLTRYPVVVGTSGQCRDLTINTGATVTSSNQPVVVNRNMTVYGQVLLPNASSWLDILGNTFWKSGSSINTGGSGNMNYYGSVTFESGSNVQMTAGSADFKGTGNSFIYNYSASTRFWNFYNEKASPGYTSISSASTQPMTMRYIQNDNDTSLFNYYTGNILLNGDITDNNTVAGKGIRWESGTLMTSGTHHYLDLHGTNSYLNHLKLNQSGTLFIKKNLNLKGNLEFVTGTFNTMYGGVVYNITLGGNWINPTGPASFVENTGKVTFNGSSHQYCNNSEEFYTLEVANSAALRFSTGATITCQVYDWTSGGIDVNVSGVTFTANDLSDNGIAGGWWLTAASTINLYNPAPSDYVDLKGDLYISSGTFNVYGGSTASYWPFASNASVTMSGGVLDFKDQGLYIYSPASYSLTTNITGGTIKVAQGIYCGRSDFTPGGSSTLEFKGTTDANITMGAGTLNNVRINKAARSDSEALQLGSLNTQTDREGNETTVTRSNTIILSAMLSCTGIVEVSNGVFDLGQYQATALDILISGTIRLQHVNAKLVANRHIQWNSNSVASITAGSLDVYGNWSVHPSANVQIPANVTTRFLSAATQFIYLAALNTSLGNLQIGGTSPGAGYFLTPTSTQALLVNGNLSITAGNELDLGSRNMSVAGNMDLYGKLDVRANTAVVVGDLFSRAGSILAITTGSFTFNTTSVPYDSYIYGSISLGGGTFTASSHFLNFEIGSSMSMSSGSMLNCPGIRAPNAGTFQPVSGTVKFTNNPAVGIINFYLTNGNWLPNFILDCSTGVIVGADLLIKGSMQIINGDFGIGAYQVTVNSVVQVYDTISMDNAAGKLTAMNSVIWYNGSVANITAGTLDCYFEWFAYSGSTVQLPANVTTRFMATAPRTIFLDSVGTSFGNLEIGSASPGGTFTIYPYGLTLIVNGNLTITAGNELDLYISNLSVAGDLDLYGKLDIHASSAGVQGVLFNRAGSLLNIDTGSFEFLSNNVYSNCWVYGTISINSGTLTSSMADLRFSAGSLLTMTSGTINCTGVWATTTGVFQPAGGTVRFTPMPEGTGYNLTVSNGNWLPNCIVDAETSVILTADLVVIGNLSINQGTLAIQSGLALKMASGKTISVNAGGTLFLEGFTANAIVTRYTTGFYFLNVESGGTLKAKYATFEYMGGAGVNIKSGAIIEDGTYDLINCTFRNGSSGGTLLTIDNAQELTITGAVFPDNTWGGASNVTKNTDQGWVYFRLFSGAFAGESYDNDDNQLVFWQGQSLPPVKDLTIIHQASLDRIQLSWNHLLQDTPGISYQIYRAQYPDGTWLPQGTTSSRSWSEVVPGPYYFYRVSALLPD